MGESLKRWDPTRTNDPPITAVISRRVKQGHEEEFEEWVVGVTVAAARFPGYLGSNIFRPSDPNDDEYQIVFGFDHASSLERWKGSQERRRWNEQARDLIHEEPRVRVLTGLEA